MRKDQQQLFRLCQTGCSNVALRATGEASNPGGVSGYLNVCGVIDSWSTVLLPGAWAPHTEDFVREGKMLFGHKWSDPEIGIVLAAEERVESINGAQRSVLWWEAEFHEDEKAQRIRKIIEKRFARKKIIDFSVGFWPDFEEVIGFKDGKTLWEWAVGHGVNMALMDPAIREYSDYCWAIPKVIAIAEGSIVNDGATPGSEANDVRAILNSLAKGDPSPLECTSEVRTIRPHAEKELEERALQLQMLHFSINIPQI